MAFNNIYPYQYYQPQPAAQNNGLIWVQGEAGAKSYLVAPNNTVQLWDSESQTIYLKSADASGMPSMRILDYTIRDTQKQLHNGVLPSSTDFPTRQEFDALKAQIEAIKKEVERSGANESAVSELAK